MKKMHSRYEIQQIAKTVTPTTKEIEDIAIEKVNDDINNPEQTPLNENLRNLIDVEVGEVISDTSQEGADSIQSLVEQIDGNTEKLNYDHYIEEWEDLVVDSHPAVKIIFKKNLTPIFMNLEVDTNGDRFSIYLHSVGDDGISSFTINKDANNSDNYNYTYGYDEDGRLFITIIDTDDSVSFNKDSLGVTFAIFGGTLGELPDLS